MDNTDPTTPSHVEQERLVRLVLGLPPDGPIQTVADSDEFRRWLGALAGRHFPPGYLGALPHGAIVAVAKVDAISDPRAKASPWAVVGQEQWRFGRVFALPDPVPCKGAQGLWRVPDDVAALVRAQCAP